jgi:hypothetical protein
MLTCGFIKVQPNGMKEKAAKTVQRYDPVSKRMVNIAPPPPILRLTVYGGAAISNPVVIYDGRGAAPVGTQVLYGGDAFGI